MKKLKKITHHLRPCLILFFAVVLMTGCVSHVVELRDAQEHFNTAASLENQLKLDVTARDALTISQQAAVSYRLSLNVLDELIEKKSHDLKKDGLLGTAYTLKAMTAWRLGDYGLAMDTINAIKKDGSIKLFPRDQALAEALSGLIKNDQAYLHMMKKDYKFEDIKSLLKDALTDMAEAINMTQEDSDLLIYLSMAKMAVLKNWLDLIGEPSRYALSVPEHYDFPKEKELWCKKAKPAWSAFAANMKSMKHKDSKDILSWWKGMLNMPESCE